MMEQPLLISRRENYKDESLVTSNDEAFRFKTHPLTGGNISSNGARKEDSNMAKTHMTII